jgi:hypothetical protein
VTTGTPLLASNHRRKDGKIMDSPANSVKCFAVLSRLALGSNDGFAECQVSGASFDDTAEMISNFHDADWSELHCLAGMHHVVLRTLPRLLSLPLGEEYEWIQTAVETEQARIDRALSCLVPVCEAVESAGSVVVIKSLDHWPDLGSDLDIYTNARARDVVKIMRDRFHARVEDQSWGDRLANKWNFQVPGLPELIEVHVRRLGQTGEQSLIGESVIARSRSVQFGPYTFRVPSLEDRIFISTLQRMFRHFYIRLCDVLDLSQALEQGVDYDYLRSLGRVTGLWQGLATYLKIVSDYVAAYRGRDIHLPSFLITAARFGGEKVRFAKKFLRIPIVPHSARLYTGELAELLWNGEIRSTLRLGLLPLLATAAALEYRIRGTDKGIW